MHRFDTIWGRFVSFAVCFLSALFAAFIVLAAVSSFSHETVPVAEVLLGLGMAILLLALAKLSERAPEKALLIGILAACLLLRLLIVLCTRMEMAYDFQRYFNTAVALAEGRSVPEQAYQAMFPHVLGYPAVLSVVYRIFGPSLGAAQALNIVLDCASCLLLYSLGRRCGGKTAAALTAGLYAVGPSAILHMPIACSEPLYMFLLLLAVTAFERAAAMNLPGLRALAPWLPVGFAAGLFNAVRPIGPVVVIAFCACFLVFGKVRPLLRISALALMLAAYVLTNMLYTVWAERTLEQPVASGAAGWNLYLGMNTRTQGRWTNGDFAVVLEKLQSGKTAPVIQAELMDMAAERVRENFEHAEMGELVVSKFVLMWGRDNAMPYWLAELEDTSAPPARGDFILDIAFWKDRLEILCNAFWWTLLLLGAPAAVFLFRSGGKARPLTVLLSIVIITGIVLGFLALETNTRYHYPVNALMAIAAGWGCAALLPYIPPGRTRARRAASGQDAGTQEIGA